MNTHASADSRPRTYTQILTDPVELAGKVYADLTVREPTAAQWKQAADLKGFESTIWLVASAASVPVPAINMMPYSVVTRAGDFIIGFLEDGQTTGGES